MIGSLIKVPMHDGSRMFAALPGTLSLRALARHLAQIPGIVINDAAFTASDDWMKLELAGWRFAVNGQFGDFWFFALDPATPDDVMHAIVKHAESALRLNLAHEIKDQRLRALAAAVGGLLAFGISNLFTWGRQSPLLLVLIFAAGVVLGDQAADLHRMRRRALAEASDRT